MRIVAVIQARLGSTRLPGKVLVDIVGHPMLWHVVHRVRQCQTLAETVVATSEEAADAAIEEFCTANGIECFRGSQNDVLDRYYRAAQRYQAEIVVRVTADCPLIDPAVIDRVVRAFDPAAVDYAANTMERTFPDGEDVEVFSFRALERAWQEARLSSEREHVTPYIWKQPKLFRLRSVTYSPPCGDLRWTVDQAEDLEFIRRVHAELGTNGRLGMEEVLSLVRAHPELGRINRGIVQNEGYLKSVKEDAMKSHGDRRNAAGQTLYRRAKQLIPGGTQLLSKRPEMFLPELWPSYYRKAQGVEVWDLDGNRFVDMCYSGIGACLLGAADPEVNAAVIEAVNAGVMSTLNPPEEVELAELLCELHPWAGMVRYTRGGGEAMSVAVRIARAKTRRDAVVVCGYHGWHDWYLAANLAAERALDGHLLPGLEPTGVPRGLLDTNLTFRYNHLEELERIAQTSGAKIGAIVMEPLRDHRPEPGFLAGVRAVADRLGAVLIFDEITAGFRLNCGGAHLLFGVEPDMAVFAKGMSNGFAMGAVLGRADVMQAAQASFISSTYWTERIGPVAALATIRKHRRCAVHERLIQLGDAVQADWKAAADKAGLAVEVGGMPPLSHLAFTGESAQEARTLFTQLMLEEGFLATGAFYAAYAHQDHHLAEYFQAVNRVFPIIAEAIASKRVLSLLQGPVAHAGFRRLT